MSTRERRLGNTITITWLLVVFVSVQFAPSWVKFFNGDQVPLVVVLTLIAALAAFALYCQRVRRHLSR